MKRFLKSGGILILVVFLISVFCVRPEEVFANGIADGTNPTGGDCECDQYPCWNTCFGYSWQSYEVTRDFSTSGAGVNFYSNDNTGGTVNIYGCTEGQTLYNYGFQAFDERDGQKVPVGQVSTQMNKNGVQAQCEAGNYWGGNVGNYTTSPACVSSTEVQQKFYTMQAYLLNHQDEDTFGGLNSTWDSVGAFCYDPAWEEKPSYNPQKPPCEVSGYCPPCEVVGGCEDETPSEDALEITFLSTSGVEAGSRSANVGPAESGTAQPKPAVEVTVGKEIKLSFKHNLYSKPVQYTNFLGWGLNRDFPSTNNDQAYTIVSSAVGDSGGVVNFTMEAGENLYLPAAELRPYTDGQTRYLARDVYNLKFLQTGSYKFCEQILLGASKALTSACAEFKVVEDGGSGTPDPTPNPEPDDLCTTLVKTTSDSYQSYIESNSKSGYSFVSTWVRNVTLATSWKKDVYAKPGDKVEWVHCYFPGVQKLLKNQNAVVSSQIVNPDPYKPNGTRYTHNNVQILQLDAFKNQRNSFSVTSTNLPDPKWSPKEYSRDETEIQQENDPYEIKIASVGTENKVGKTLTEKSSTSWPGSITIYEPKIRTWKCNYGSERPDSCVERHGYKSFTFESQCQNALLESGLDSQVYKCYQTSGWWIGRENPPCAWGTCGDNNEYIAYDAAEANTSSAWVNVPYNYTNTIEVSIGADFVYAGESVTGGSASVTVHPRWNNDTKGEYATQVPNATVSFSAYLKAGATSLDCQAITGNSDCSFNGSSSSSGIMLNSDAKAEGVTEYLSGFNGVIPDAPAGSYFCLVGSVSPADSGDRNMSEKGGIGKASSGEVCALIAKRPSIQVWGSGMYSNGFVSTSTAKKRTVSGFIPYNNTGSNTVMLGSWVEGAIVSNGKINGVASGAATGFPGSTSRTLSAGGASLSGSKESGSGNYCATRVPLTIPNAGCNGSTGIPGINIDGLAGGGASISEPVDRDALMDRFMEDDGTYEYRDNYTALSQLTSELGGNTLPKGVTYVLDAKGKNFVIDTDIYYAGNGISIGEVSKLVIRADNIDIRCSVGRIDAVLIADKRDGNNITGVVNTCADGYGDSVTENSLAHRSNQLKINGTIITGSLRARRTYGAGNGAYSAIPAEIIDYDTSLYLWGAPRADAGGSGKLDMVYIHELSPRL